MLMGKKNYTTATQIQKNIPVIKNTETIAQAKKKLQKHTYAYIEYMYVTDENEQYLGYLRTSAILGAASKESQIADLPLYESPVIIPEMKLERVAGIALQKREDRLPVTDKQGHFLGIIDPVTMMNILRKEHIEDMHQLVGINKEIRQAARTLEETPVVRARERLPWLLVGLVGSMLSTFLMRGFEEVLQSQVALAFFVPGIVYLADAIGTQSETIAVRGISLHAVRLSQVVFKELRTGLLIGGILGLIFFPFSWLMYYNLPLSLSVSLAIVCAGGLATTIGILFPWILHYFKVDPAFGSGPLATIIQDLLSILIFFWIAQWMM